VVSLGLVEYQLEYTAGVLQKILTPVSSANSRSGSTAFKREPVSISDLVKPSLLSVT
jgi:hypothetical protein